jgi:hypothetical protein
MPRIPLGRVKPPELAADNVRDPLKGGVPFCIETRGIGGFRAPQGELCFWPRRNVVSKLKITRTIRAKVTTTPIKRAEDDFTIDLEELIDMFPC